jgi:hypothetical protein
MRLYTCSWRGSICFGVAWVGTHSYWFEVSMYVIALLPRTQLPPDS